MYVASLSWIFFIFRLFSTIQADVNERPSIAYGRKKYLMKYSKRQAVKQVHQLPLQSASRQHLPPHNIASTSSVASVAVAALYNINKQPVSAPA